MLFHVKKPKRLVRAIKKKALKTYIPRYPFTIVGSRSRPSAAAAEDRRGRKRSPKTSDGATVEKIKKERPPKREKKKKPEPKVAPEPFLASFILFSLPIVRQLIFLLRLLGWVLLDIARSIIKGRKFHVHGIWCFVGLQGFGKTMSLVHYLDGMRRKYGEKLYIATNFAYKGEDFSLNGYESIIEEYDKPIIFGYDELQNEFNTRQWKTFPIQLVSELTQNRKGNGKQVVYTTQRFGMVDKNFRDLTNTVIDCRSYVGGEYKRLMRCKYYKRELFECRESSNSVDRKFKIKPFKKEWYIATDYLRSRYDSFKRLDYLKSLDYVGLQNQAEPQGVIILRSGSKEKTGKKRVRV